VLAAHCLHDPQATLCHWDDRYSCTAMGAGSPARAQATRAVKLYPRATCRAAIWLFGAVDGRLRPTLVD
jgi:hypothetical protein